MSDLRLALRSLLRRPGFSAVAVLTLALGIGGTTAVFSVVDGVLLSPLPYPEPERLVMVWEQNFPRGRDRNVVGPANFLAWRDEATAFESLAAMIEYSASLTGGGAPERVGVVRASASLFPMLGASAAVGRVFGPEEDAEEAESVALLGHGFWRRRYGGDPGVVGRTLTLNGSPVRVVGVLPEGFGFDLPYRFSSTGTQDVWVPMRLPAAARTARGRSLQVVGKLREGVSLRQAQDRMGALARRLEEAFPERQTGWGVHVVPLQEQLVGDVRQALLLILGAVGLVLLIACANVANLLLARGVERQQEIGVRSALGAGRGRLARQLLAEAMGLAALGGALGVLLGWLAVRGLVALAPDLPRLEAVGLDGRVLAFALGLSLLTGLVFGLLPSLRGSRVDLSAALKEGGARGGASRWTTRTRGGLVVAEVGLSLMLLVGAGLLLRSFANLLDVGVGFETGHLLAADLQLPSAEYPDEAGRARFFDALVERVEALPGVERAGAITFLPLSGAASATSFWPTDRPVPADGEAPVADVRWVDAGYFGALGLPLLAGRTFDARDSRDAPLRVVVSRAAAEALWPGRDAVGREIDMPWDGDRVAEVIGVVDDVRHEGPASEPRSMLYWHHAQFQPFDFMTVVARTSGPPARLAAALRAEVAAMDPNLPLYNVRPVESYLSDALARARFATTALGLFAATALALACVGIYGVLSYSVQRRTREFGIRMAVGARRLDVVLLVLKQGGKLVALALAAGILGAAALSRLLEGMVYEVSTDDPLTFAHAALAVAAVALLACWLPARRATRVDPVVALRAE